MPKKKLQRKITRKLSQNMHQKKAMTARLMVINLKIDDCVYKNKPISIQDAEMYAKEMKTYRQHCLDERYFQVIEKLMSYMEAIIKEQTPKYMDDVKNIDSEETIEEVINDKHDTVASEYNLVDVELEKSISNLSIVDPKNPLTSPTTEITDNIHEIKKGDPTSNDNTQLELYIAKQNEKVRDNSPLSQNLLSTEYFEYGNLLQTDFELLQSNINTSDQQQQTNIITNSVADIKNNVTNSNFNNPRTKNKDKERIANPNATIQKEIDNESYISQNILNNFAYEDNIAVDGLNYTNRINLHMPTNTVTTNLESCFPKRNQTQQIARKVTFVSQEITALNKTAKVKEQKNTIKKEIRKTIKRKGRKRKHKVIKVNNKQGVINIGQTVNMTIQADRKFQNLTTNSPPKDKRRKIKKVIDLSWVENLKFVRVIETEEYTKDNLEETFWSDLSLPPKMSSMDFDIDDLNIWKG